MSSVLEFIKNLFMLKYLPELGNDVSFGILFILGLLTSFHCMGMCGGIAITQSLKSTGDKEGPLPSKNIRLRPSILYNLGRVLSYTIIGGIVGGLGNLIGFTGILKGVVPLAGGIFMIIMGINLLGIFPWLRRFNIRLPAFIAKKIIGENSYGSFIIGVFSGLMPCGPLQIVQIYALGTKSVLIGAASMFVFSLGTVPLMFFVGTLSSIINKKHTNTVLRLSSIFVILLGLIMVGRGLSLSGHPVDIASFARTETSGEGIAKINGNIQTVETELKSGSYPEITVQKGIPVKWTIHVSEDNLNNCNSAITIPKLKLDVSFKAGDNIIEFTPYETGEIPYSCWMGMIRSKIIVVENLKANSNSGKAENTIHNNANMVKKTEQSDPCNAMPCKSTSGSCVSASPCPESCKESTNKNPCGK